MKTHTPQTNPPAPAAVAESECPSPRSRAEDESKATPVNVTSSLQTEARNRSSRGEGNQAGSQGAALTLVETSHWWPRKRNSAN